MDSNEEVEEYQSSGEEWNTKPEKKRSTRRASQRLRKKPRISVEMNSSDSEYEVDLPKKTKPATVGKRKAGRPRKNSTPVEKITVNKDKDKVEDKAKEEDKDKDFNAGSFLVLRKDLQGGDLSKPPCLWRIDGKALLQKYEVFVKQDKTLHRNTSIYTGWSTLDKDLYAPVTVKIRTNNTQEVIVELNMDNLKNLTLDSDSSH